MSNTQNAVAAGLPGKEARIIEAPSKLYNRLVRQYLLRKLSFESDMLNLFLGLSSLLEGITLSKLKFGALKKISRLGHSMANDGTVAASTIFA